MGPRAPSNTATNSNANHTQHTNNTNNTNNTKRPGTSCHITKELVRNINCNPLFQMQKKDK